MSSDLWRWADPNGQQRKVRLDELRASLAAGIIAPNAPVWRSGFSSWQPANEVPELTSASVGGANGVVLNIPPPPLAMVAVQQEYESKSESIAPMPPTDAAPDAEPPPPPPYVPAASAPSVYPSSSHVKTLVKTQVKTQMAGSAHVPGAPPVLRFGSGKPPPPPAPKLGSSLPTTIGVPSPPELADLASAANVAEHAAVSLPAPTEPVVVIPERLSLGGDEAAAGLPRQNVLTTLQEDIATLRRGERPKSLGLVVGAGIGVLTLSVLLVAGIISVASGPQRTVTPASPPPSARPAVAAVATGGRTIPPPPPVATTATTATSTLPPPPEPRAAALGDCSAAGDPKVVAPRGVIASGIEAHALGGGLALGFAATPREAVVTSLDSSTLTPTATVRTKPIGGEARRVTPLLVSGKLTAIPDVERKGDRIAGRRIVAASTLIDIGSADAGVVWAPHGRDSFAKLFALEGEPAPVEALRAIPLGDRKGIALAFRRGSTIYFGAARGAEGVLDADGDLSKIAGLGGQLGSPAIAVSGDVLVVAWADRAQGNETFQVRFATTKVGGSTQLGKTFTLPDGGLGGQAMSPSVASLGGGRFLLTWTEGPVSNHQVRAITMGADGVPSGMAIAVSPAGVNAGQPSAVISADGRGAIAYLSAKGKGLEVHATPISCATR